MWAVREKHLGFLLHQEECAWGAPVDAFIEGHLFKRLEGKAAYTVMVRYAFIWHKRDYTSLKTKGKSKEKSSWELMEKTIITDLRN